jgi:hypothetical protein
MLHFIGALTIFPWRAAKVLKWSLHDRWLVQARLIRSLRSAYGIIAEDTLFPQRQKQFLNLDEGVLKALQDVRNQELATLVTCQAQLMDVLLETRWSFTGNGVRCVQKQNLTRNCTRVARSAADDLLQKYERVRREYQEFGDALAPSDIIPDSLDGNGLEHWKEVYLQKLDELSVHLEMCCGPLAMLMVLECDTQPQEFHACIRFLRKRQVLMDALWLEIEDITLSWGAMYLQQIAHKYTLQSRMNKEEPLKKTKLFTYVIHLDRFVSAVKEAWTSLAKHKSRHSVGNEEGNEERLSSNVDGRIDLLLEEIKKDPFSLHRIRERERVASSTSRNARRRRRAASPTSGTTTTALSQGVHAVINPLHEDKDKGKDTDKDEDEDKDKAVPPPLDDICENKDDGGWHAWSCLKQDWAWEWLVTLSPSSSSNTVDMQLPPVSFLETKGSSHTRHRCGLTLVRILDSLQMMMGSTPFHVALKFSLGTTLIVFPSYLPSSSIYNQKFADVQLFQGVFAFQVILYRLYLGFVFERTFQRLAGVFIGYIYLGMCWGFAQQTTTFGGWLLFGLGVPAVWLYVWINKAKPTIGYIGFAFVRTYAVLAGPLILQAAGDKPDSLKDGYWFYGAWTLLSTFFGALIAVFAGVVIWPTSGRKSLKLVLANTYR